MKTNLIANRFDLNGETVYFISEGKEILFTLVKATLWELRNTLGELVKTDWNRWAIIDSLGASYNSDGSNSGLV